MSRWAAALAIAVWLGTPALAVDAPERPKEVGLLEHASTRLAQIDVTVAGAKEAIEGLTSAEFEVRVNDTLVPNVLVDDLCIAPPARAVASPGVAQTGTTRPVIATYLLFFDMAHLTQSGRQVSIAAAREMLPKLLAGGNRAMIVASAAELKTVVPLTTDAARLEAALSQMVNDQSTFDTYAATEDIRLADVIHELDRGIDFALALARRYAADERWRQERDLRRLSMVLGRLAELDPPKAVLYFADTMRQNAGEHYLSFFSGPTVQNSNGKPTADAGAILADAATGALPLDRVVNEAAALGVRFYAIEGQGVGGGSSLIQSRNSAFSGGNQASAKINSQRIRDAQGTLDSLAAETGGRSFLNGVAPSRMATQILADLSCVYLLSFDPKDFPQDKPLTVAVAVKGRTLKTTVRGRLVIQSDSARLTGRVLSAFASPEAGTTSASQGLHVGLIPIGYKEGAFKARVQVAVAGSKVPVTTWDIGASLVSHGVVRQDGSGQIQVTLPNTPVVYEQDMDFAPGEYELVAVAHELQTDTLLSKETRGAWPKLDTELASLGPIAVSQPRPGGFVVNGKNQTKGAVVVGEDEPLRSESVTAVFTLVCRAQDQKRPLSVVRHLVGERDTPVGTTQLDMTAERCAQVIDFIPPKMLGAGRYRFVVTVSSDGQDLARGERALSVPEAPPAPTAGGS